MSGELALTLVNALERRVEELERAATVPLDAAEQSRVRDCLPRQPIPMNVGDVGTAAPWTRFTVGQRVRRRNSEGVARRCADNPALWEVVRDGKVVWTGVGECAVEAWEPIPAAPVCAPTESPSVVCRRTGYQACHHCDDVTCGDNTSPAREACETLRQERDELLVLRDRLREEVASKERGRYEATPFQPPVDAPVVAAAKDRWRERGKREAALGDRIDEDSIARLTEERDGWKQKALDLGEKNLGFVKERDEARELVAQQKRIAADNQERYDMRVRELAEARAEVETLRKEPRRFTRAEIDLICRAFRIALRTDDDRGAMRGALRAIGCEVEG